MSKKNYKKSTVIITQLQSLQTFNAKQTACEPQQKKMWMPNSFLFSQSYKHLVRFNAMSINLALKLKISVIKNFLSAQAESFNYGKTLKQVKRRKKSWKIVGSLGWGVWIQEFF